MRTSVRQQPWRHASCSSAQEDTTRPPVTAEVVGQGGGVGLSARFLEDHLRTHVLGCAHEGRSVAPDDNAVFGIDEVILALADGGAGPE